MRKITAAAIVAVLLSGLGACSRSFEKEKVDGVECVVARNAFGRPRAVSCNWEDEPPSSTQGSTP